MGVEAQEGVWFEGEIMVLIPREMGCLHEKYIRLHGRSMYKNYKSICFELKMRKNALGILASYSRPNKGGESGVLVPCVAMAPLGLSLLAVHLVDGPKGEEKILRQPLRAQAGESCRRETQGIAKGEALFQLWVVSEEPNRPKSQPAQRSRPWANARVELIFSSFDVDLFVP